MANRSGYITFLLWNALVKPLLYPFVAMINNYFALPIATTYFRVYKAIIINDARQ